MLRNAGPMLGKLEVWILAALECLSLEDETTPPEQRDMGMVDNPKEIAWATQATKDEVVANIETQAKKQQQEYEDVNHENDYYNYYNFSCHDPFIFPIIVALFLKTSISLVFAIFTPKKTSLIVSTNLGRKR